MNKHFTKEGIREANKHMNRCSSPLVIREMQIKIIMRYFLTSVRMVVIKIQETTDAGEVAEKKECVYTVGENVN